MFKVLVVVIIATLSCHAFPRYHRLRREAESIKYGPCKNTYDQCPEWKGEGMCTSEQYKDYMMTVCPVTCEFCKEKHVRDEIEEPEDSDESFYEVKAFDEGQEEAEDEPSEESGDSESDENETLESGSGKTEESGSGSGTEETKDKEEEDEPANKKEITATGSGRSETNTKEENEEAAESESGKEEDEENEDSEDAKPVQTIKQEKSKKAKQGTISLLLKQTFKTDFQNPESASFKMLSGNVERDFKAALHTSIKDISFSEGSLDGNPRQSRKTKVNFNLKGGKSEQKFMKKLSKLVDKEQSINGLSVYSGSLEFDE